MFSSLVRGLFALLGILAAAALGVGVIALIFIDEVPLGTPSAALTAEPEAPYIDMHAHVAGIGAGDSECFVSEELLKSYKFRFYLKGFGVSKAELEREGDGIVVQRLSEMVEQSKFVSHAVVLALDGALDDQGELSRERTQVYVPNEFIARETAKYPNLLWGASINPYRPDALERLEQAKADGAVLVKWIPSIMHIDPSDQRLIPFYKKMVELGLPLLTHAGQEKSFAHADDELADPVRLTLPLTFDVTVIAAHVASTGETEGVEYFHRLIPMFERFPNLYTDISSLTQINKLGYLAESLAEAQVAPRMLYGSDWPLQFFPLVSPWFQLAHISLADAQHISQRENPLDRDVLLKKAMGVPEAVFIRAAGLLPIRAPAPDTAGENVDQPAEKEAEPADPS